MDPRKNLGESRKTKREMAENPPGIAHAILRFGQNPNKKKSNLRNENFKESQRIAKNRKESWRILENPERQITIDPVESQIHHKCCKQSWDVPKNPRKNPRESSGYDSHWIAIEGHSWTLAKLFCVVAENLEELGKNRGKNAKESTERLKESVVESLVLLVDVALTRHVVRH